MNTATSNRNTISIGPTGPYPNTGDAGRLYPGNYLGVTSDQGYHVTGTDLRARDVGLSTVHRHVAVAHELPGFLA